MTRLTEKSIRRKLPKGNNYLHRAIVNRVFQAIPKHLLQFELFKEKNNHRETPLHIAAQCGHLNQIPSSFLTRKTLVDFDSYGRTPLHLAAYSSHAYQIPKEFLTPEFLSIPTKNEIPADTVFHIWIKENLWTQLPDGCITPDMWNLKNGYGITPLEILEQARETLEIKNKSNPWRNQPMSEKQKEKLRYFGCTWDEGITKGQASDALDECVKRFPNLDIAYYSRPATEEQLAYLRPILKADDEIPDDYADEGKPLTYQQAKDLIWEIEIAKRHQDWMSELEQKAYQLVIMDFLRWRVEHYRHLTYSRVKKAAKALDESNPGWSKLGNCQDFLLEKVVELNPEWAEKERWV